MWTVHLHVLEILREGRLGGQEMQAVQEKSEVDIKIWLENWKKTT